MFLNSSTARRINWLVAYVIKSQLTANGQSSMPYKAELPERVADSN
eukprot:IDg7817t1